MRTDTSSTTPDAVPDPPGEEIPAQHARTMRSFLWNALIDGLGSYLAYMIARRHMSELGAIGWSMLPPAVNNIWSLIRKRHLDLFGVLVIVGLLAGLGLFLLGGSPRLILVRDSLITGVLGLALLVSLLSPRPLLFYVVGQISKVSDPEMAATWEEDYARSETKYGLPLMTAVWGLTLVVEAVLRTILALTLRIPVFMAVSPVMNLSMYAGTSAWSFFYGRRMREKEDQRLENEAVEESSPLKREGE